MDSNFSLTRVVKLIQRQWLSVGMVYLMTAGVLVGIIVTFYTFEMARISDAIAYNMSYARPLDFRTMLFFLLGLLFMTLMGSSYFMHMGSKGKAIFELLIPAKKSEKMIAALFFTVLFSTAVYLAIFFAVDFAFISILKSRYPQEVLYMDHQLGKMVTQEALSYFSLTGIDSNLLKVGVWIYLLNALFLLGSISFKNYQFVKTAISIVLFSTLFFLCKMLYNYVVNDDTVIVDYAGYKTISEVLQNSLYIITISVTVVVWGITFLKLKEKEV